MYRNATEVENVQESLLLHLDGELSEKDIVTVEKQIQANTLVEEEWRILRKTKLQIDEIAFPGKASLYRHEGRIIYRDGFKRIAAAIAGLGMFFAAALLFDKPGGDTVAVNPPVIDKIIPVVPPGNVSENVADPVAGSRKKMETTKAKAPGNTIDHSDAMPVLNAEQKVLVQIKPDNSSLTVTSNVKREQKPAEKKTTDAEIQTPNESIAEIPKVQVSTLEVTDTELAETKQQFARLTLNEEGSSDRILYIDEDKLSRTKLAGIFRRVKRVVERNTKIKTGNGFRIGGFEIAVK